MGSSSYQKWLTSMSIRFEYIEIEVDDRCVLEAFIPTSNFVIKVKHILPLCSFGNIVVGVDS